MITKDQIQYMKSYGLSETVLDFYGESWSQILEHLHSKGEQCACMVCRGGLKVTFTLAGGILRRSRKEQLKRTGCRSDVDRDRMGRTDFVGWRHQ